MGIYGILVGLRFIVHSGGFQTKNHLASGSGRL